MALPFKHVLSCLIRKHFAPQTFCKCCVSIMSAKFLCRNPRALSFNGSCRSYHALKSAQIGVICKHRPMSYSYFRPTFTEQTTTSTTRMAGQQWHRPLSTNTPPEKDNDEVVYGTFAASAKGAYRAAMLKFWLKNGFYLKAIMLMIDPTFKMKEFLSGTRQAFEYVTNGVENNDTEGLKEIMTSDALQLLESMSFQEKEALLPAEHFAITAVPDTCGLIIDKDKKCQWFEIVVTYFFLRKTMEEEFRKELTTEKSWSDMTSVLLKCTAIVNYRFVREYTKNVEGYWVINDIKQLN